MTASVRWGLASCVAVLASCNCGPRPALSRGELRLAPASLSFSAAPGASETKTVMLSNTGTADVAVTGATIDGDARGVFRVMPVTLTVRAGSSAELQVTYAPALAGDDTASIVLEADASNGTTFVIGLLGSSRAPFIDAGPPDAGPPDAGPPDAGPPDAGPPDAGPPDAGPPDAGPPDAGPPDAGPPDAGPPNVFGLTSGLGTRVSRGGTFSVEGAVGFPAPRVVSRGGSFSVEPLIPPGGN